VCRARPGKGTANSRIKAAVGGSRQSNTKTIVAASFDYTCVLDYKGFAKCWGKQWTTGLTKPPVDVRFRSISARATIAKEDMTWTLSKRLHMTATCGIEMNTNRAHCWGVDAAAGVTAPPQVEFESISVGPYHACGEWCM